jgi:glyoxylase-like metal-dependent hydrolase (beta-lactamase superfamily II)
MTGETHMTALTLTLAAPPAETEDAPLDVGRIETHLLPGGGAIHHFATGAFNWYVVEEAGRLTLVDGGFPGHERIFRAGLAAIGRRERDLEAIVLTHAHADHMGFIERVRRRTGAPVFVHAADARAAQRRLRLPWTALLTNAWHPSVAGMLWHATANGIFTQPAIAAVRTVEDGAALDIPGRPRVIHAPGHTPGEIALWLDGGRVLLAGDVLITRHLLRGHEGTPQLASRGLNADAQQANRSLDRVRGLGQALLLTGHGPAWQGDMAVAVAGARGLMR